MKITCLECTAEYDIPEGSEVGKAVCPKCHTPSSKFFVYSRSLEFDTVGNVTPLTTGATDAVAVAHTVPYAPNQIPMPERIGRYEILGRAGAGGMGVVYRARDLELGRTVALKVVIAGEHATEATIQRFQREARSAAKLSHPGIVRVYDVGTVPPDRPAGAPIYYFAMEYVDGRPIDKIAHDPGLKPEEAARIARDVARALQYAHEQGIIHRDVKPGNILVDAAGHPRLLDFGLAKEASGSETLTKTGEIIGTACYMPPEQASGDMKTVEARSDIYSLGTVLYEMLTKRPPFLGESMARILRDVEERDPEPPSSLAPGLPREIEVICLKAMAKEKDRRYQTARELADDLDRFLGGQPILARPTGIATRTSKWVRRHPAATTALVMLALFSAVGVAFWMRPSPPAPIPRPDPMLLLAMAEPHYAKAHEEFDRAQRLRKPEERRQRIAVFAAALAEVEQAISLYDRYAEAYALRGAIRVHLVQGAKALEDFDTALALKPTLADVYYDRVVLRLKLLDQKRVGVPALGMDTKPEEMFAPERPRLESDIERLKLLGIRRYKALVAEARFAIFFRESGENPMQLASDAIAENSGFADAYVVRAHLRREEAVAMRRHGDRTRFPQVLQEALEDATRAIEKDENHAEAYRVRAEIHLALGRRADAMRDLDEMVAIAPEEAQSYVDRASILSMSADRRTRARVLEDVETALRKDPDNARARYLRATARIRVPATYGDEQALTQCREDLSFVIGRDPKYDMPHVLRMVCDRALGDEASFKQHFDELAKARPDLPEARLNAFHSVIQNLGRLLQHRPKLGESESLLERAGQLVEGDKLAEAEQALAQLLARLDDPVAMSLERLPAAKQKGLRISAHRDLAALYALRGEPAKAVASLAKAVDLGLARPEELEFDPDFESLRALPEFRELLKRPRR